MDSTWTPGRISTPNSRARLAIGVSTVRLVGGPADIVDVGLRLEFSDIVKIGRAHV
jgi:hypothetical protein